MTFSPRESWRSSDLWSVRIINMHFFAFFQLDWLQQYANANCHLLILNCTALSYTNHAWSVLAQTVLDLCSQESTVHLLLFHTLCRLKSFSPNFLMLQWQTKNNKKKLWLLIVYLRIVQLAGRIRPQHLLIRPATTLQRTLKHHIFSEIVWNITILISAC